ncbi:hypothetical protein [Brevundimonas sp.]|jgi:hypothetical protein
MHRPHLLAASIRHDRRPAQPSVWRMTADLLGMMFAGVRPTPKGPGQ